MNTRPALIIEPETGLAHIFEEALKLVGLPTEILVDTEAALKRLPEVTPGIILLSLTLPNTTGIDLLQYIRDQVHLRDVPVIVITPDTRLAKRLQGTVNLVLVKPITYAQLAQFAALIATL